jgi:tetratricopeptide (TPR) repeat protein
LAGFKVTIEAYLGLARIAFREESWQEVARLTNQVAKINPIAFPAAYLYNAAANFNLGNFAAAEKSARRFESLDPEHERPKVYLFLGDVLACEHDFVGAVQQKRIFLRIVPDAPNANEIRQEISVLEHLSGSARK